MPPKLEIKFDQINVVYFGGQIVSGKVTITNDNPKRIKGILLSIHGFGKAEWYNDKNKKKDGPADYSGLEEYLCMNTHLLDSNNGPSIELPAGSQSYIFKCQLPDNLPSSYEGIYGHVRYIAKVTIERPWKHDYSYSTEFNVYKIIDLEKEYPQFKVPIEVEEQKHFGCLCCKTAPLIVRVRIPQTGFSPGQIIPINIHMTSKSIEVIDLRIFLRKVVTYRAEKPMVSFKQEHIELIQKNAGSLQSGSTSTFEEKLIIPPVPPTTLMHSKIIQINYDVKIDAILMENRTKLILLCPIIIGSAQNMIDLGISRIEFDQRIETDTFDQQIPINSPPPEYVEVEGHVNEAAERSDEEIDASNVSAAKS